QTLRERFGEREAVVTPRVRKLVWVPIINAVDLCGFQNHVCANLARSQCCGRVSGKIRVAGAGGENHNSPQPQMPNGAAEVECLGSLFNWIRGLGGAPDSDLLQCAW